VSLAHPRRRACVRRAGYIGGKAAPARPGRQCVVLKSGCADRMARYARSGRGSRGRLRPQLPDPFMPEGLLRHATLGPSKAWSERRWHRPSIARAKGPPLESRDEMKGTSAAEKQVGSARPAMDACGHRKSQTMRPGARTQELLADANVKNGYPCDLQDCSLTRERMHLVNNRNHGNFFCNVSSFESLSLARRPTAVLREEKSKEST